MRLRVDVEITDINDAIEYLGIIGRLLGLDRYEKNKPNELLDDNGEPAGSWTITNEQEGE